MSMCHCDLCENYIDSDFDMDCFVEDLTGHGRDRILCERCREREDEEQERYEAAQGKHEAEAGV